MEGAFRKTCLAMQPGDYSKASDLAPGEHAAAIRDREQIGRAIVSGKGGVAGKLSFAMGARLAKAADELRKLVLAEQLVADPNLLVLDELANHLDADSIEALQRMLADFPGTILLVAHDGQLADAAAQTRRRAGRNGDAFVISR